MSTIYPDLSNNFPDSVDNFDRYEDPNVSDLDLIDVYYAYIQQRDLARATQLLNDNPQLKTKIVNAAGLNKLRDGLISVERLYLDDVQQYLMNIVQYKGEWSATTTYGKYNVVTYTQGASTEVYMGIVQNIPLGIPPTTPAYWVPLAIKGDTGDSGLNLSFRGAYNGTTAYPANVAVEYQGSLYGSLQATQGNPPTVGGSNAYWALAWDFQIPNNYITYSMLNNSLQSTLANVGTMTDTVTGLQYRFGVENGAVYIEEI